MKIGLALAGGGLQGIAHIGVLKALEELDIKIDYISGTSSGSIFAVLYALGFRTEEIEQLSNIYYKKISNIEKNKIVKIIKDYIFTKQIKTEGLIDGQKVEDIINEVALKKGVTNINEIEMPIAIPTIDTITTDECVFVSKKIEKTTDITYIEDANIGTAVRASMAFPGIFNTCNFREFNFIDGGTKDNLPIKPLIDMGANYTIGVSFDISHYEVTNNLFNVILRAVDIFSQRDVVNAQKIADIAFEIDTNGVSLLNIEDMKACIEAGYNAIMSKKEKLLEDIKIEET